MMIDTMIDTISANKISYKIVKLKTNPLFKMANIIRLSTAYKSPAKIDLTINLSPFVLLIQNNITNIDTAFIASFTYPITFEDRSTNFSTTANKISPIRVTNIPIIQHLIIDKNPLQFNDFNFCILPPTIMYFR